MNEEFTDMATLTIKAEPRTITGRKVRQLRNQGLVPVVVYGAAQEATNLQVNTRSLERTLHDGGMSQLVEIQVAGGGKHNVLVREVQRHPLTHTPIHADFYAVNMREKQVVSVPVHAVGKPDALATGLMMLQALDQVELEALPSDIPAHIEVDVTALDLETPIHVSDLPVIDGVEYVTDSEEVIFTMVATRVAAAEEEEAAEGDMAEPEVLTGAKDEEDE